MEQTMASVMSFGRAAILGLGLIAFSAGAARAQAPPAVAEINACLCLQQAVGALSVDMSAKNQALNATTQHLADLDAQLARERPQVNVNNPDSVARYKALLEQRDAAYRQSIGPVHTDAAQATARYNTRVNEYNAQCANRPGIPVFPPQIPLPVTCPPLQ
jgi:hypothetical protein